MLCVHSSGSFHRRHAARVRAVGNSELGGLAGSAWARLRRARRRACGELLFDRLASRHITD